MSIFIAVASMAVALNLTPLPTAARQEVPREVLRAVFGYYASQAARVEARLAVDLDRFPDRSVAARAAENAGVRAGIGEEVRVCNERSKRCNLVQADQSLSFVSIEVSEPGKEVKIRLMLSTQVFDEGGVPVRTFPSLREITVTNDRGWTVTEERVLVQG